MFLACCVFFFLARNPWHWCHCSATARWVCIYSVCEYTICINSKTIAVLSLSHRMQRGNIPLHQDVLCSSTDKEMHPFTLSLQVAKSQTNTHRHFKLLSLSCWHSPLLNLNKEIVFDMVHMKSTTSVFCSLPRVYVINKEICVRTVCQQDEILMGETLNISVTNYRTCDSVGGTLCFFNGPYCYIYKFCYHILWITLIMVVQISFTVI